MCVFIFIIRWTDRLADGHTASGGAKTGRAMLDLEREKEVGRDKEQSLIMCDAF